MSFITRIAQPLVNLAWYGTRGFKERVINKPRSFRSFYAGAIDRLSESFKGTELSINEILKRTLDKTRYRCRELVNDNDYGKKYINMVKTNVVGAKGVRLQARSKGSDGKPDQMDNEAIETAWKDFSQMKNCGVTGKLTMLDIERVSLGTTAMDGECLIRFVYGSKYKYGMALQLIEIDRLDTQLNREATQTANRIVMGVELDEFDVPTAYYVMVKHPSETTYTFNTRKYMRIPAEEILHLFLPERIAQARGIPWMHSAVRRINMIGGYEEAELVGARSGASKGGFYYTENGEEYTGDGVNVDGTLYEDVEPGVLRQLPAGVKFEPYDPQHPTGAFNYFMRGVLKGAAAGLNVSYTGYSGDLEAVNYSSIRAGLIDERENWRVLQGWFVEHVMAEIYERWLSGALTRGLIVNKAGVKLPLHKKEKFLNVHWQVRGWAWVDPLKDEQANVLAVRNGHMTNTQVAAAQGDDLEEIYETLAYEKKLAKSYGLDFSNTDEDVSDEDEEEDTAPKV